MTQRKGVRSSRLRNEAEDKLTQSSDQSPHQSGKTQDEIIHELRVHQIELDIQNEELKKAYLELETSKKRYIDLYDFAPVGYITLTDTAMIAEVNLTGATMLGVVRQQIIHTRFRAFVPADQYDVWDRFFLDLLSQDENQTCEVHLKTPDGMGIDTWIEGVRVDMGGGVFQVRIIVLDISNQKEVEEKVLIFTQIADQAPASIMVHDFDGNIFYANAETFRLHGYTPEEFLTKNLHDIDVPESEQYIQERMQKIRDEGEAAFEVYHYRKDGSSFPLEVHGKIISWAGRPVLLSIATDLTEKKRTEKILIESEERFRGLIRDIPDLILVHRNGIILFVNPAAASALKYTPEEMTGFSILDFVAPESRPLGITNMQERAAGKNITPYEITILTKEGEPLITEVRATLIQYGGETASLVVLNNITERKQAEYALHEAVQKLRLLTGLTRHDVMNQLTAMQLILGLALETENTGPIHEYISHAIKVGEQIEASIGFTRDYENFGMISSGWHLIHRIIDGVISEFSHEKITIQTMIPNNLEVYADPIIRKVFATLVENSIRHGGNEGSLRFSCRERGDSLIISYQDDGIGIPFEEKELILQKGYGKHTGIGLYLASEILSINGFSIQECGVEGEGARFEITVPAGKFRRAS
ncbi:MAG TPA: PAS domain S-box protein [Methanospirillum sp.]|nr:PAS domain S-box protein [Methanospirillum sp.]